jgi:TonB-dependent starch-binding outer membrane protein SusC
MKKRFLFLTLILFLFGTLLRAQVSIVTGVVTGENNEPLPGTTIQIKGTSTGTTTDIDGKFTISVEGQENPVLVFSFIGYLNEEVVVGNQTEINVSLVQDILSVDEVVVVGYGTQKKSLVTGAISKINADEIASTHNVRVEQALQGKTSGVFVSQESGSPGADIKVQIRGAGTNGNAEPLYVVDGIRTGGIDYLTPSDIESIEILKDAASAAIYGSDAANGVVLITTKKGKKGAGEITYDGYYGVQNASHYTELMNPQEYINYYQEAYAWQEVNDNRTDAITEITDPAAIDNSFSKFPYIIENGEIYKLGWTGVTDPKTASNATSRTGMGQGTNWMEELINPAPITNHTLSVSGGSESSSYYLSGGYFNQKGIIGGKQSNYDKYSFRFNGVLYPKKWISFYTNIGYTHKQRTWIGENDWFGGDVTSATRLDPLTPVYADSLGDFANLSAEEQKYLVTGEDGRYYAISELVAGENANPLASIKARRHDKWQEDKMVGGTGFDLKPIKDLKIHCGIDMDLAHALQSNYDGNYYLSNDLKRIPGANDRLDDGGDPIDGVLDSLTNGINLTYQTYKWITLQNENYVTYSKQLGNHNISLMGGMSVFQYTNLQYSVTKPGLYSSDPRWLVFDDYPIKKYIDEVNMWGETGTDRMVSYYSRLSYNCDEKYMGTVNFRADGSSKFGSNNKFGYFPSISAGWVISREPFFPQNFIVNLVKLRASYGVNGSNTNLGRWKYLDLREFNSSGSIVTTSVSNPDLRWEQSVQTDFALDLALLNNKITLTADYFIKNTEGLLLETSVLASEGEGITVNAGEIQNKGIELELGFRNHVGRFNYDIGINGSYLHNEVTSLNDTTYKKLAGANIMGETVTNFQVGYPVWYLYGFKTGGVFQNWEDIDHHVTVLENTDGTVDSVVLQPDAKPGDIILLDIASLDENGKVVMIPDGQITEADKTMVGNPHPDFTFGLNATLEFFNFDLQMFFQGVLGNEIYLYPRTERAYYNRPVYMYDERWTGEGSTNDGIRAFSAETVGWNKRASDYWVYSGSYLRLKQLSIGYTIPNKISSKALIQKFRVYFSANNVLTFTKYPGNDPEVGGNADANSVGVDFSMYPSAKSYTVGVNLVF